MGESSDSKFLFSGLFLVASATIKKQFMIIQYSWSPFTINYLYTSSRWINFFIWNIILIFCFLVFLVSLCYIIYCYWHNHNCSNWYLSPDLSEFGLQWCGDYDARFGTAGNMFFVLCYFWVASATITGNRDIKYFAATEQHRIT